eukprot:m.132306 g.132306  ORF g.132306 m.132306 type:complete len:108 (-) comp15773_c2_seq3:76-399(-)
MVARRLLNSTNEAESKRRSPMCMPPFCLLSVLAISFYFHFFPFSSFIFSFFFFSSPSSSPLPHQPACLSALTRVPDRQTNTSPSLSPSSSPFHLSPFAFILHLLLMT